MKKLDRDIIDVILKHIASDDKLEEDIAAEIERYVDEPVDFHKWLIHFEIKWFGAVWGNDGRELQ